MSGSVDKDELISQYVGITGESTAQARQYLAAFEWDLPAAIEDYYSRNQDSDNDADYVDEDSDQQSLPTATGGHRLGDAPTNPQQPTASASSPARSNPQKPPTVAKKFATLNDFGSTASKDDSDDDDNQDLFAGGEKSGLAVQNPDDLKRRILEKAQKSGGPRPKEPEEKKTFFTGSARTLGGDDAPSREIPAMPQLQKRAHRVDRVLHFWRDGFSVDDGDLYHIDDPRNAEILNLIRQGRAPLHIMNVESGQEVDVEIKQHDENYVKPKKQYKPFGGQGNRLGSPTPGASTTTMPGAFTSDTRTSTNTSSQSAPAPVDESKPLVTIRITLGSGKRLTSRFNTDQTIGDIYTFVENAENTGRNYVLQTTFPTMELTDRSKVLGDMPEFKRGGAVVQKYI